MRSTSFLTFFILALLSVLQLSAFAEPLPADNLVERGTDLDIAPTTGGGIQQSLDGGPSENEANKSEKLVCPRGTGFCPNDRWSCCPLGGACCGNRKCCSKGRWCYGGGCCLRTQNGCDGKSCIPRGANCCQGGSYCKPGYRCIRLWGRIRCCPNGKLCLWKDGTPADNAGASD